MMMMSTAPIDGSAAAYGDIAIADVFESVLCWLPVSRSTLNALSHSCHAARSQMQRHRGFAYATFVCRCRAHLQFWKRLDASKVPFPAVWRYCDRLSTLESLSMGESRMSAKEIASIVSKSPNLVSLDLCSTKVDDDGIVAISALRHLEVLTLDFCCSFTRIDPLCEVSTTQSTEYQLHQGR